MPNPKLTHQSEDETLFESEFNDGGPWYESYSEKQTFEEQLDFFIDIDPDGLK